MIDLWGKVKAGSHLEVKPGSLAWVASALTIELWVLDNHQPLQSYVQVVLYASVINLAATQYVLLEVC